MTGAEWHRCPGAALEGLRSSPSGLPSQSATARLDTVLAVAIGILSQAAGAGVEHSPGRYMWERVARDAVVAALGDAGAREHVHSVMLTGAGYATCNVLVLFLPGDAALRTKQQLQDLACNRVAALARGWGASMGHLY